MKQLIYVIAISAIASLAFAQSNNQGHNQGQGRPQAQQPSRGGSVQGGGQGQGRPQVQQPNRGNGQWTNNSNMNLNNNRHNGFFSNVQIYNNFPIAARCHPFSEGC